VNQEVNSRNSGLQDRKRHLRFWETSQLMVEQRWQQPRNNCKIKLHN